MKIVIANQDAVASITVADLDRIFVVMSMNFYIDLGYTSDGLLMRLPYVAVCLLVMRRPSVENMLPTQVHNAH